MKKFAAGESSKLRTTFYETYEKFMTKMSLAYFLPITAAPITIWITGAGDLDPKGYCCTMIIEKTACVGQLFPAVTVISFTAITDTGDGKSFIMA